MNEVRVLCFLHTFLIVWLWSRQMGRRSAGHWQKKQKFILVYYLKEPENEISVFLKFCEEVVMISWMKLVVSSQLFPPITAITGRGGNGSERALVSVARPVWAWETEVFLFNHLPSTSVALTNSEYTPT